MQDNETKKREQQYEEYKVEVLIIIIINMKIVNQKAPNLYHNPYWRHKMAEQVWRKNISTHEGRQFPGARGKILDHRKY